MMLPVPGIATKVAARIRELRLDAEMTQTELARRIGIHRPVLSRIESGKHLVDFGTVARIAAAFELDLGTVLVCLDDEWCTAAKEPRMKARNVVLSVVVTVDEKGDYHGSAMLGEVALVTGPWTTVDALLHHVGRVFAERKHQANTEHHDADARTWLV
jgi:transcriptional regulator with XRE-family HTH domain